MTTRVFCLSLPLTCLGNYGRNSQPFPINPSSFGGHESEQSGSMVVVGIGLPSPVIARLNFDLK
jgi:hypothetical protein